VGVFQVESRAQMQSLPRTKPSSFEELGVQVAIIRPGPLQGNMVAPYIRRKQGLEPVVYLHPTLEPVLKETLGVVLFQEQVLKVAVAAAGFTPAQADALRRAMSRKRSQQAMEALKEEFLNGAARQGISSNDAADIFHTLEGFALYGFCKSHALSFARIAYVSGWLKRYYPTAFVAALLNNQPMGFYSNDSLVEDAKRHGVVVKDVDINRSQKRCHVEYDALRLGFILVNGLSDQSVDQIIAIRDQVGPFQSLQHLLKWIAIDAKGMEGLIEAGAFDSFGHSRRELLWQLWLINKEGPQEALAPIPVQAPQLPASSEWALMQGEYRSIGFSPQRHPMKLLRSKLPPKLLRSIDLQELEDGHSVLVAGVVSCLQKPPTAKGFAFITLEDEYGMMNVVIQPKLYQKERSVIRQEPMLIVRGVLQKRDGMINIQATRVYGQLMAVD
jgi:error-prone DNA polymerase